MPPAAHHFTPVWPLHEPQQSFRSKQYAPPRKRKRQGQPGDESDSDSASDPHLIHAPVQSHDIKDPYRVAGWSESTPLPAASFPHAPASRPKRRLSAPNNLQKELADLKPPLYIPPPDEYDTVPSIRRHHLGVLTTILHTSLLRRDFVRAGRAWGMIMRTAVHGGPFDVRTNGRWGIGAEILMRKFSADSDAVRNLDDDPVFSDESFEAAKDYYERLILQHPYQKTKPHTISSLTFYPAMFGLCIYEIQQKSKIAVRRLQPPSPDPDHSGSEDAHNQNSELEDLSAIKRSELGSVKSLIARMDELMLSPPFDTNPPLLQLRASVALWLVDLYTATAGFDEDQDENNERASMERAKAKRCMERMRVEGVEPPEMLANLLD